MLTFHLHLLARTPLAIPAEDLNDTIYEYHKCYDSNQQGLSHVEVERGEQPVPGGVTHYQRLTLEGGKENEGKAEKQVQVAEPAQY